MIRLQLILTKNMFSNTKTYYPFFLSPDYELLEYHDTYVLSIVIIVDEGTKNITCINT